MHFQDVGTFIPTHSQTSEASKSSKSLDTAENFSEFFKAALQEAKKNNRPFDWKDASFLVKAKKATHIDQELFNNFPKFDRQELFNACPNLLIYINLNNEEEYPIPVKNLFGSPLFKHQIDGEFKDCLCYTEKGSLSLFIGADDLETKHAYTAFFEIYSNIAKMDSLPLDQLLDILVTNDYFQDEGIYQKADECLLTFLGQEDGIRIFLNEGKISKTELFSKLTEKYHSLNLFPKIEALWVQLEAKNGNLLRNFDENKETLLKKHGPSLDSIYFPLTDDIDKDREILKAILDSCPNIEELLLPEIGAFPLEELKFQGKLDKIGIGSNSIYSQKILEKTCEFVGKESTIQDFTNKIKNIGNGSLSLDSAINTPALFQQAVLDNTFYVSYGLSTMDILYTPYLSKKEYTTTLIEADPKLYLNKKFMSDAIRCEPNVFETAPDAFKRDISFICSVIGNGNWANTQEIVPCIDEKLRNDPDFMRPILHISLGFALQFCGEKIYKNKEFIREIVDTNLAALPFISDEFKNDAVFMKPYIEKEASFAFEYSGKALQNNKKYALMSIASDVDCIKYLGDELRDNTDFLKEIIILYGNEAFQHMSIDMQHNPDIANFAINRDLRSIQSIGETLKKDKKFMKPLIAEYGSIAFNQASKKVQRSLYGHYFMQKIGNIFAGKH